LVGMNRGESLMADLLKRKFRLGMESKTGSIESPFFNL
jgi:hypothetical protein